jgi:hypothetical protein
MLIGATVDDISRDITTMIGMDVYEGMWYEMLLARVHLMVRAAVHMRKLTHLVHLLRYGLLQYALHNVMWLSVLKGHMMWYELIFPFRPPLLIPLTTTLPATLHSLTK